MRLFLAVVPPLALRAEIAGAVAQAAAGLRVRWTPAENLHLTLAFLDEIAAARLDGVLSAVQGAAARHAPFELALQGLGAFDSLRHARVLLLRTAAGELQLSRLAADVVAALPAALRPQQPRAFSAHLTLARPRTPPDPGALQATADALAARRFGFSCQSVAVMESRLAPSGATYYERGNAPLRG
jgi:2'-5' RNA ligase